MTQATWKENSEFPQNDSNLHIINVWPSTHQSDAHWYHWATGDLWELGQITTYTVRFNEKYIQSCTIIYFHKSNNVVTCDRWSPIPRRTAMATSKWAWSVMEEEFGQHGLIEIWSLQAELWSRYCTLRLLRQGSV